MDKKKKIVLSVLLLIFVLAGCGKSTTEVDDINELPEDGIVSEEIISAFAGTDRVVSFYSTDENTGIKYVWELDGISIKNPKQQNLKLTFGTEELSDIKKSANDASYALAIETYDSGLVCIPTLTITVPEELDIDSAYLCLVSEDAGTSSEDDGEDEEYNDDNLVIMSDVEITTENGYTSLSMSVQSLGGTLYIVGGNSDDLYETVDGSVQSDTENVDGGDDKSTETSNDNVTGGSSSNSSDSGSDDSDDSGKSSSSESQTTTSYSTGTCTISINCSTILDNMDMLNSSKKDFVPSDGWILKPVTVAIEDGDSVHDILQRVCRENNIHMESTFTVAYNSAYVEGINQLYEFDCGELSGWMYSVNGWFPNYGCSQYTVKDNDVIKFLYTCDLGRDVGDNSLAE